MSNGLGAGFAAITLVGILLVLATVASVSLLARIAFRRRSGEVPTPLRYLGAVLLVPVVAVSGFGVLAMYDEAPLVATLLVATVAIPLVLVGARLRQVTGAIDLDLFAATTMAWGPAFLLGVAVTLGIDLGAETMLGLAPAEPGRTTVIWVATAAGGTVTALGAVLLGGRLLGGERRALGP